MKGSKMGNEKKEAISNYLEQRKEEAKKTFQSQVNSALNEISTLSKQLKSAKERLLKLEYIEPEAIEDID